MTIGRSGRALPLSSADERLSLKSARFRRVVNWAFTRDRFNFLVFSGRGERVRTSDLEQKITASLQQTSDNESAVVVGSPLTFKVIENRVDFGSLSDKPMLQISLDSYTYSVAATFLFGDKVLCHRPERWSKES